MVSANPDLLESNESERKIAFGDEPSPRIVQLLGAVPAWMNRAASFVEKCGADIIDINMGCPAKKICKTDCGSALMKNLPLADEIIRGVCGTVSVPVTLKMRTGWDSDHLNAPELARIAESAGVRLITVHGRTREQSYSREAEYRTIRAIRSAESRCRSGLHRRRRHHGGTGRSRRAVAPRTHQRISRNRCRSGRAFSAGKS